MARFEVGDIVKPDDIFRAIYELENKRRYLDSRGLRTYLRCRARGVVVEPGGLTKVYYSTEESGFRWEDYTHISGRIIEVPEEWLKLVRRPSKWDNVNNLIDIIDIR